MKQLLIYSQMKVIYRLMQFPLVEKEPLFRLLTSARSMREHNLSCQSSEPISCRSCSCSHINTQHSGCWRAEREEKSTAAGSGMVFSFDALLFSFVMRMFLKIAFFFSFGQVLSRGGFKVTSSMIQSVWTGFVMMLTQAERCILPPTKAK